MNIYTHGPSSGQPPKSLVILLHGYGSNGEDLISLAPYWDRDVPDAVFVSPDAPFGCEIGFGYQWFSLQSWAPLAMLSAAERTAGLLNTFIDEQMQAYNIPASKVAFVGFSQGTMMSLFVAPRRKEPIAGVLGFSGALLGGEGLIGQQSISRTKVHLVHGEMDPVVPVGAWLHATETLRQAGFDVSGHTTPGLAHSIDEKGIHEGGEFLKRILT
ncbi:MAG: hypothetical protein AUJ12_07670 [Alphaproteobacteria bacterium CG1_02_46_17]|nr:MAG: hypothetical protein AUJ12_07670 [Alphaproteobacteria bacterium CG1_02_46_17]